MALNILSSPGEQKVNGNSGSFNRTNSAITGLSDGGWVVTWTSTETTSGDIYQRHYTAAHGAVKIAVFATKPALDLSDFFVV